MSAGEAFVTLAATDSYCMGAIVVAKSLRRHGTTRKIIVMVTPNVSEQSRLSLENVFDEVIKVDILDSEDNLHLSLLGRPELGITFTKIYCWTLIQYRKCVFLDADTLVLCNVDELFERDELSAAPDPSWPDCFNSGVFVFVPSLHTNISLLHHSEHHGSFDGGDQGLLNSFFGSWSEDIRKHLPFVYNLSVCSIYTFLPAFQQFGHDAKIVHFLGPVKPWNSRNQRDDSLSPIMEQFVSLWWKEYLRYTTLSLPVKNFTHVLEKQQPVQGTEAKMPFRETLDSSNSVIAPFSSPPEQFSPHIQPNMVSTEAHVSPDGPPQNIGDTKLEEETSTSVGTDIQEPEGLEGRDGALNTGQHSRPADTEADLSDHRRLFEAGHIDYLDRDAFQNIQKMLDCFLYSEDLDHMCNTNLASLS